MGEDDILTSELSVWLSGDEEICICIYPNQDLHRSHLEGWVLELLNEVIAQQSVFELVNRASGFGRQFSESAPD
jgi:hypothetical protein